MKLFFLLSKNFLCFFFFYTWCSSSHTITFFHFCFGLFLVKMQSLYRTGFAINIEVTSFIMYQFDFPFIVFSYLLELYLRERRFEAPCIVVPLALLSCVAAVIAFSFF